MPVVVEQRKLYRQPGSGAIRANRSHFAAADLQYLYVPQHGLLRNVVGSGEILPRLSNAAFSGTVDGWGASSTSSSSGFQLSSIPRINALNSAITLLWRGVMFGDTAGNNVILFGQTFGNYAANPFTVAAVGRAGTSGQNLLSLFSNNGAGSFLNWQFDCGLSSHYGRVVTFAASQRLSEGRADAVFVTPTSTTTFFDVNNAQSGVVGTSRNTSSSDELFVGGAASDSTRHPNAAMTLAAAWSRALTLQQLVRLAQDPWSITQGSRVVVPFGLGGAGSYTDTLTDSGAAGDTLAGAIAAQAAVSDAAAAGEALTGDVVSQPLGSFTFLFSQLLRGSPGAASQVADALAASDTVGATVTLFAALSDAVAAGEVVLANGALLAAVTESAAAADTVAATAAMVSLVSDSAAAADTVAGGVALISVLSESTAATDAVVSSSAYTSAIADSASATDAVAAAAALLGALADGISATDAATATAQLQAAIADALVAADLPIAILAGLGTIADNVLLGDGTTAVATLRVTLADALTTGDAVTAPSAATYQINVSVAWAAPAGTRIWAAPATARTWVAPSINRVWN